MTVGTCSLTGSALAGMADPTCSGWVLTRTRLRNVARSKMKKLTIAATMTPIVTIAT